MSSMPEPLDLLKQLVAIPSVFPGEQQVSATLAELLTSMGFSVERVISDGNRPSLIGTFGKSDSYLAFYGHMDTVPAASDYERNPFEVEVDGNIARGLGVCDMKGGLTCILQAAAWAASENLPVKVVFGVDEENISQGACDLIASGKLKDVGFMIVAESGQVVDFKQPLSVCLGRKGRIVFEIQVQGKAAHAAEKHKGINAIEKAAQLITALQDLSFPAHPNLGNTSLIVQGIQAQASAFSLPESCTVICSFLTTPGVTSKDFIEKVQAIAERNDIKVTVRPQKRNTPYGEAFEISKDNSFFQALSSEVLGPLGAKPMYTPSVADENFFAHGLKVPVLTIGAIGAGDHTKDEWVNLDTLRTVIDTYQKAIALYNSRKV